MASFRLYRLDGAGKIASAEWLEADGDGEAERLARAMDATVTLEIWDRNRFVARIDPAGRSPAT